VGRTSAVGGVCDGLNGCATTPLHCSIIDPALSMYEHGQFCSYAAAGA
jgi:hypothetical protein